MKENMLSRIDLAYTMELMELSSVSDCLCLIVYICLHYIVLC